MSSGTRHSVISILTLALGVYRLVLFLELWARAGSMQTGFIFYGLAGRRCFLDSLTEASFAHALVGLWI
jgi:hypothetical protein